VIDPGIPEGFSAHEATELRLGVWRFYRVEDPDRKSSVREDNWVTRDGVAMPGVDGLRAYLADIDPIAAPERIPAELLAAQAGYFLIRGDSRQSSRVEVVEEHDGAAGAPTAALENGRFVLRVWYQRDGYRQPLELSQDRDGNVDVSWGAINT
jgi:hypothetical protein